MFVVGIDVGSVRRHGGFAWAAVDQNRHVRASGADNPTDVAHFIVEALAAGKQIAVAVEAPLAVPVPDTETWHDLFRRGRSGEGNRPWSAGAGTGALATGLVQLAWLCSYVAEGTPAARVTTFAETFRSGEARLLIAEALVSADGKPEPIDGRQDHADAVAAALRLLEILTTGAGSDVSCDPHTPLNLAAAAALFAGLYIDPRELTGDVIVAKARPVSA